MKIINPYNGVNWATVNRVQSLGHGHSHSLNVNQAFKSVKAWYDDGIRHFAYSNYYPSSPTYPIGNDSLWCRGVTEDNVKYANWIAENHITDIIQSPNAEHHNVKNTSDTIISRLHINGIGSTFSSGNPPNVSPVGCQIPWSDLFDNIIDDLQYDDAGGITINHPVWTMAASSNKLTYAEIIKMLDYDHRVLGIEIYNHTSETSESNGWALDLFDQILKTGRKCWGFAVPDHHFPGYKSGEGSAGRNVLLVESKTEYDCLKAYRNGNFYCQLYNTDLKFSEISLVGRTLNINAPYASTITFVTDRSRKTVSGETASYRIPSSAIYVRAEATGTIDGVTDQIFSQPIMLGKMADPGTDILLLS